MYLAVGLGIFAALVSLVTVADLSARIFAGRAVIGYDPLPVWRVFLLCALVAATATVAIWLLRVTLPLVFA